MRRIFNTTTALAASLSLALPQIAVSQEQLCADGTPAPCAAGNEPKTETPTTLEEAVKAETEKVEEAAKETAEDVEAAAKAEAEKAAAEAKAAE